MGDWELLTIKLALEKWRKSLEGMEHPQIIWMDHKYLTYVQAAKCLNAHQARWALAFAHFNLTITYRPISLNIKPDPRSHQFSTLNETSEKEEPILPAACIIKSLTWEIKPLVKEAQQEEPEPGTRLSDCLHYMCKNQGLWAKCGWRTSALK